MLRNVQALRAAAALLVVFDHFNGELSYDARASTFFNAFRYIGNFGVDIFFAISGFIMLSTTWTMFAQPGASRMFLIRRIARIYPPYWLVLAPIVATYLFASHAMMKSHAGRSDILSSMLLLPQVNTPLLIVSWTLVFEMFFYLVFAVIIARSRRWFLPSLGVWFVLQLAMTALFVHSTNPYLGFLSQPLAIEFMLGTIVGYSYVRGRMPLAAPVGILGLAVVVAVWVASRAPGLVADLAKNDITRVLQFGVPAAMIVYGLVGLERRGTRVAPEWSVHLGDASYALYLWHVPITIVFGAIAWRLHVHGFVADTLVQLATLVAIVGVSLFVYRYFEVPVTRALNARFARRGPIMIVGASVGPALVERQGT